MTQIFIALKRLPRQIVVRSLLGAARFNLLIDATTHRAFVRTWNHRIRSFREIFIVGAALAARRDDTKCGARNRSFDRHGRVAELADALDLGSSPKGSGFKSLLAHQFINTGTCCWDLRGSHNGLDHPWITHGSPSNGNGAQETNRKTKQIGFCVTDDRQASCNQLGFRV